MSATYTCPHCGITSRRPTDAERARAMTAFLRGFAHALGLSDPDLPPSTPAPPTELRRSDSPHGTTT